ncbi:uncharacterized protein N7473_002051 [Penicillium subrubescens]|uniref:Rhodopsin domain-containing protein n=1 Tax=Penicillium subrubescens TaxID=1316194 RepID=A0A1Q5UFG0_9EURO|nr:uncharacterized protein N7473_002051 [Penicillium subrubescens]KAJ5905135.1 hypothetical protein N7473_002051 [Penicillium subrubescens]OKP11218.1 hypothetical protein PENSUB_3240 [Penicillium subrubescens]
MSNSNGYSLERGIWAAVIISALIVMLRVYAKIKIKRFHADDVLMIIAQVLIIVSTVFLSLCVQHGFGGDLTKLPKADSELVLKYIAIQIPLVTFSTTIARTGFIIYLLAVLGTNKNYKIALWVVLVIQAAGNTASAVLPLSICRDVRALWDLEAAMHTTCGDTAAVIKFAYYSNTFNSATDFFLAVFPTVVFWNLNLKLRIKIGLIVLLSVGFIAMIASIIKTTKLDELPGITNLGATGGVELIRWGYVENSIIIITSSIPCIRPLIISSVRKFSSVTRSYELSGPFSGHRTQGNETNHSKMARRFNKSHNLENGSVERILDHSTHTHTSTTIGGRPDTPEREYPGITKQVEISVVSDDHHGRL